MRDPDPQVMLFCDLVTLSRGAASERSRTSEPLIGTLIGPLPMDTEEDYAIARTSVEELKKQND